MNRRLLVGLGGIILLIVLAGCTSFGGATSESGLAENTTYDWDTETDVVIDLDEGEYTAVYDIENQSSISIYQSTRYGTEHPIGVRGVQFRYPNGTVVNASAIEVSESRSAVNLDLPAENGQLAFTAPKRSNQFALPVFIEGSYTVKVPEGHRVDNMILATVRPGGYESELVDDRVHLTWADLTSSSLRVEYYLARDLYLFAGLIVTAIFAGGIGIGYVYRQILQLQREREELGLDVDVDDDPTQKGPPPGMR